MVNAKSVVKLLLLSLALTLFATAVWTMWRVRITTSTLTEEDTAKMETMLYREAIDFALEHQVERSRLAVLRSIIVSPERLFLHRSYFLFRFCIIFVSMLIGAVSTTGLRHDRNDNGKA